MQRLIDFVTSRCVSLTFGKGRNENSVSMTLTDESGRRPSMFSNRILPEKCFTEDFVLDAAGSMLDELEDGSGDHSETSILADAEKAWMTHSIMSNDDASPDCVPERIMQRSGFLMTVIGISNRLYEKAIAALELPNTVAEPAMYARFSSPGVSIIASERRRQVEEEAFSHVHDDRYTRGELLRAAGTYLADSHDDCRQFSGIWPWNDESYKHEKTKFRKLVMVGALVAAEIDRRIRCNDVSG